MWTATQTAQRATEAPAYHHTSVLLRETIEFLAVRPGGLYVDVTLGGGGHSAGILRSFPNVRVVGIDRDPTAIEAASKRLAEFGDRFQAIRGAFADLEQLLADHGIEQVDGIIADLGISSAQLEDPSRGMSFMREGPLDMRMDPESGRRAIDVVRQLHETALANLLYEYGEERRSHRVARSIKLAQQAGKLRTTLDLRHAVVRAVGASRRGGVDPATKTFQALRIAVNGELDQLDALLQAAPRLLVPGGRLVVLSFHSLEDRRVKRAFQNREIWKVLTKKPLMASPEERHLNRRARSAKLRAAAKLPVDSEEGN